MMISRTRAKIRAIELATGKPIARVLADDFNAGGRPAVARRLGISEKSIYYWLALTGVRVEARAVTPVDAARYEGGQS